MWMGGTVPLGYDVGDRKLVVNGHEAETVRAIFGRFVELKSVQGTLRWAQRQGLKTKHRSKNGTARGGRAFEYGSLRCILSNRLYAGQVEHKGKLFPGRHEAIVDEQLFEVAQTVLAILSSSAVSGPKLVSGSLLQGLIVDRHGRTMGPVHTTRNGQRFRYYVTHPKGIGEGDPAAFRLAADAIENVICELLVDHLTGQVTNIDARSDADRIFHHSHRQRLPCAARVDDRAGSQGNDRRCILNAVAERRDDPRTNP